MQIPNLVYFVIRKYKDGHEETDGQEFPNPQLAGDYLTHLTTTLSNEEKTKIDELYIDSAVWLYEESEQ